VHYRLAPVKKLGLRILEWTMHIHDCLVIMNQWAIFWGSTFNGFCILMGHVSKIWVLGCSTLLGEVRHQPLRLIIWTQ